MIGASRGLLLDFGGVLTPSVGRQFRAFERAEGLPKGTIFDVMARAYGDGGADSDIARLERGELPIAEFERRLADDLASTGHAVAADGLVARLFTRMGPSGRLWGAARTAREHGVRTGLLSNSWGIEGYPTDLLATHFDVVVVSADVGMRKPEPAMFDLATERLGVPASGCVFVDDLDLNVVAARRQGMTAVHHDGDEEQVLAEVSEALGVDVTDVPAM